MIEKLETEILNKLSALKNVKLLSSPIIDFDGIRQNSILNLQYVSETFLLPNERKMQLSPVYSKRRISDINFRLTIYYKNLRNIHSDVYELLNTIIDLLNFEVPTIDGYNLSPILIKDISFKERNSNNFLVYESTLEIRVIST